MSQTYRIGSLNFTGSQAVLSASLDVSGSGRFTNGLIVTRSLYVTGSEPTIFSATGDILEVLGSFVLYGSASISDSVVIDGSVNIKNNTRTTGSLDVSGSGRFTSGLTVTGSLQAQGVFSVDKDANGSGSIMIPTNDISGSMFGIFGFPSNPKTGSMFYDERSKWLWVYTGEDGILWRYVPLTAPA